MNTIFNAKKSQLIIASMIIYIILSFLPGCVPEETGREIFFVQITDTHFDESGSRERIEKVISSVNQLPMKIECVIHTGDITHQHMNEEPPPIENVPEELAVVIMKALEKDAAERWVSGTDCVLRWCIRFGMAHPDRCPSPAPMRGLLSRISLTG
jgi:3',5'-cyclic AMP phosphodiesterase CpdA